MKINSEEMQSAADIASDLLKAMANRHRLLILCQLIDGELSVGELSRPDDKCADAPRISGDCHFLAGRTVCRRWQDWHRARRPLYRTPCRAARSCS